MSPEPDEGRLRLYLLGVMPEDEAQALEDEYFARPEVLERVRAAEDDLLDDHAAGRLARDERAAFEGRYLASTGLRQRVLAARALRQETARPQAAHMLRPGIRWRAPVAIAAGLLLAVLAIGLWPPRARDEVRASPPPASASPPPARSASPSAEASPAPPPAPATSRLVVALAAVRLRAEAATPEMRLPPGPTIVVLELEGDPLLLPPGSSALAATIDTVEGRRIWRGPAARRRDPRRPSLVASVDVPAGTLAPGDYIATLSTAPPSGATLYRYFFRVRARS
jgi:hypothetical protein